MVKILTAIMLCTFLFSCGLFPTNPIRSQEFRNVQQPKKHLIVLLSGRGATFDYFEKHQWVEIAAKYTQDYDFIAPFAHYGYYLSGKLVARLHEDIILPAKQLGYETISMAGISLGGLGCILYSEKYPDEIDRIYLFSPFLGKDAVHAQIKADGGLAKWHLRAENQDDWNYYIWRRIQEITNDPVQQHKLFLGYGDKDRLNGQDLLANALPQNQVIKLNGNHDDVTFIKLWQAMLQQDLLRR